MCSYVLRELALQVPAGFQLKKRQKEDPRPWARERRQEEVKGVKQQHRGRDQAEDAAGAVTTPPGADIRHRLLWWTLAARAASGNPGKGRGKGSRAGLRQGGLRPFPSAPAARCRAEPRCPVCAAWTLVSS